MRGRGEGKGKVARYSQVERKGRSTLREEEGEKGERCDDDDGYGGYGRVER
jgi:hypothetical protein